MSKPLFVGKDLVGGIPSQPRPDLEPPKHWRLEDVFATARPHHPTLSPDRSTVAFVLDLEGTSDIWSLDLATGEPTRLTTTRGPVAYWTDDAPTWSPEGQDLAYNHDGKATVVPSSGGPTRHLVDGSAGPWLDAGHLSLIVDRGRFSRLAVIDVDDPWPAPIGPGEGDVGNPVTASGGRILITYFPKDDLSRSDIVVVEPDGSWRTLVGHSGRRAANHTVNGDQVAYTLEDGDWAGVFVTGLDTDRSVKLAGGDRDFSSLAWAEDGRSLFAIATARGTADLVRIDHDGSVETVAPGGSWDWPIVTPNGVVAIHEAADSPPAIYLVGDDGARSTLYDGVPAPVRSAPHSKMERVTFTSYDGLEIEGFLFRPADTSNPVPAVVYPHGGPTDHYGDEWDGHAQYFVDKGYAWLAINFRGSTSYGLEFERANHGEWGVGDVEDCQAAAAYLGELGWVDPSRIAIFGVSYGSYLVHSSLVHPENRFACGASKSGDIDILTSWAQGDRVGREDLERQMGHPSDERRAYHVGSPIHRIERITRPLLLAHGEKDGRVHPKQAEELVEGLERVGATYEYITYPEEGHGVLRRDSQLHFFRRLERFLDWYLI
ncbi:MAG TPA: S9 family peptidase [Acidimicrobiia bacterium]|nr:S9 family peptidase [Acidimicrobiia bacterium]